MPSLKDEIELEIYVQNSWHKLGVVWISDPLKSTYSNSTFEYDMDYFENFAEYESTKGLYSASVNLELNMAKEHYSHWPGFLLDLMPQGAARKIVCEREQIVNSQENDFVILKKGAVNPIGNIRVKNSYSLFEKENTVGFYQQDLIDKNEEFLEHAQKHGALIVGTSGAQGESPKFLLGKGRDGKWYCDGSLKDKNIEESFLVKFPRGKSDDDRLILKAEEKYMKIATQLGIQTNPAITFNNNMLFIQRFDRKNENNFTTRFGFESVSSCLEHYQFGQSEKNENIARIIFENSSEKIEDTLEYVKRDFLNIVMGNTDNHARNTALIKHSDKKIRLSPLYDFAPMVMDPEMIPRCCRWDEENSYIPNFHYICEFLGNLGIPKNKLTLFFTQLEKKYSDLKKIVKNIQLEEDVVNKAMRKYEPFLEKLKIFNGQSR